MMTDNVLDFESYIIGALCNFGQDAFADIFPYVTAEDFQTDAGQTVFQASCALRREEKDINPASILEKLKSAGYEPQDGFLRECMTIAVRQDNAVIYAKEVHERAEKNRFGDSLQAIADGVHNGSLPLDEARTETEQALSNICFSDSGIVSADMALQSALQEMEARASGIITTTTTGFQTLDGYFNGGLENGALYIIGARPASGKTTLGMNMANAMAMQNRRVLFVSLEMTVEQLSRIRLQLVGKIQQFDLYHPNTKQVKERIEVASELIKKYPVDFNKPSYLTVPYIEKLCQSRKYDVVVIDYLQLIRPSGGKTQYEKITQISRAIKLLALSRNIPVVCLSQLSRGADGTEPKLSDLRDSGAIEQDADAVMLLFLEDRGEPEGNTPAWLNVKVAKNRYGEIGTIPMNYYMKTRYIEERYRR